jgi:hypothetical protein
VLKEKYQNGRRLHQMHMAIQSWLGQIVKDRTSRTNIATVGAPVALPVMVPGSFGVNTDNHESPSVVAGVASRATRATTNLGWFRLANACALGNPLPDVGRNLDFFLGYDIQLKTKQST